MDNQHAKLINQCRRDLQKERIIKSVLCGMIVGLSVTFIVAFITWVFSFKGLWLSLGLGVAVWAGAFGLFYALVFKVNDMAVMKRIDALGLDERMITMYEFQDDNSYMAQRQREDAASALSAAVKLRGGRSVKADIAVAIICVASVVGSLALGMSVVTGLSDYGVIPTLYSIFRNETGGLGPNGGGFYTITYTAGGEENGGWVNNSTVVQVDVEKGGSSSVVASAASSEYYLEKWVDENGGEYYTSSPVFAVDNVQKSMTYTAIFSLCTDGDDLGIPYYYDPDKKGDPDDDSPRDNDPNGEPDNGDKPEQQQPLPQPSPGGGTPTAEGNTVLDGQTQYGEVLDGYMGDALGGLSEGGNNMPPELGEAIEGYYGTL